jgi:hypothetical protein
MASFPGPKVHRRNRRKLGRGQSTQTPAASLSAVASTVTVTVTSNVPIIVSGVVPWTTDAGTLVSQAQTSPTTFNLVFSTSQAAATYSLPANCGAIRTFSGGGNAALSGTF